MQQAHPYIWERIGRQVSQDRIEQARERSRLALARRLRRLASRRGGRP